MTLPTESVTPAAELKAAMEKNIKRHQEIQARFDAFIRQKKEEGKTWFNSVTIVSEIDPKLGDANSFLSREDALKSMKDRIGDRFNIEIDYESVFDWKDGEVKPGAEAVIPNTNQIENGMIWGTYIEPGVQIPDQT